MASNLDPDFFGHESNPYAPPTSHLEPRSPAAATAAVPFDLGSILSATWTIYKERLGGCIGVCGTVMGLIWGSQFLQRTMLGGGGIGPAVWNRNFFLSFAVFFCGYVFNTWLGIGQNLAMLTMARSEPGAFEQLFSGFRFVLTSILAAVLFMLAIGLIVLINLIWVPIVTALLGQGHPASIGVFGVAVAIACAFAVFVATRLSQFSFFVIDQSAGTIDSLSRSWDATRGRAGTVVAVYTMLGLINLGGLLTCFVGLVFTIPFSALMLAVTYLSLTGQPVGGGKPAPWDEIAFERD